MRLLIGILLVAFCLLAMAKAEDNVQALQAVVAGTNRFSSSLFHTIVKENPGNLVISPLALAIPLAMAGYAARGETERQLKSVLHMPSSDSLGTSGYQALIDSLNNVQENRLVVASKLLVAKKVTMKPSFKELIKTYFRPATGLLKTTEDLDISDVVNTWVGEIFPTVRNRNRILSNSTGSVSGFREGNWALLSLMVLKATWKYKFIPQNTKDMPFYVTKDAVKQVPTMTRTGVYRMGIIEELDAQFIVIPYEGDELSMVIILPKEIDGLAEMKRKMQDINLSTALRSGRWRDVRLFLPKFTVMSILELDRVLKEIGLVDAFTSRANFSGISDDHLTFGSVKQFARVVVDEEGSSFDPITGEVVTIEKAVIEPSTTVFKVDHPFVFSIVKSSRNLRTSSVDSTIIFTGCVQTSQLTLTIDISGLVNALLMPLSLLLCIDHNSCNL